MTFRIRAGGYEREPKNSLQVGWSTNPVNSRFLQRTASHDISGVPAHVHPGTNETNPRVGHCSPTHGPSCSSTASDGMDGVIIVSAASAKTEELAVLVRP